MDASLTVNAEILSVSVGVWSASERNSQYPDGNISPACAVAALTRNEREKQSAKYEQHMKDRLIRQSLRVWWNILWRIQNQSTVNRVCLLWKRCKSDKG